MEYTDATISALLTSLTTEDIDQSIKPEIVTTLAEIALSLDVNFSNYMDTVLKTVVISKNTTGTQPAMRESVVDLYSGVIQGIQSESKDRNVILNYSGEMLHDLYLIAQDEDTTDTLLGSSCGLLGDLALNYPQILSDIDSEQMESLNSLLTRGKTSDCNKTKTVSFWASRQLSTAWDSFGGMDENVHAVKKARVGEEVYYSMRITVSNKQYITQNIETENVTIKLKPSRSGEEEPECNHVEATVRLPPPVQTDDSMMTSKTQGLNFQFSERTDEEISELRRLRKKRVTGVPQQEWVGKKSRDAMDSF